MKYEGWFARPNLLGRVEAMLQRHGGEEAADRFLADETRVVFQNKTAVIEDAGKTLFDSHGRCIPPRGLKGVADANYNFHLIRLERIDSAERIARLCEHLRIKEFMTAAEFEERAGQLIRKIEDSDLIRNAVKGDQACPLPLCLPKLKIEDYGRTLKSLVEAAARAYKSQYPKREFNDYRGGELTGQTIVIGGLRYELLLERLTQGPVVGIYLPNALQGFSVFHQRVMPAFLPQSFCLSGGVDTTGAMAMWPDVLARDFHTPGLDMSALQWRQPVCSLYFRAYDERLYFDSAGDLGGAGGGSSGGLFFLG